MINKHGSWQDDRDRAGYFRQPCAATRIRHCQRDKKRAGARRRCQQRGDFKKYEKEGKCEEATRIRAVGSGGNRGLVMRGELGVQGYKYLP